MKSVAKIINLEVVLQDVENIIMFIVCQFQIGSIQFICTSKPIIILHNSWSLIPHLLRKHDLRLNCEDVDYLQLVSNLNYFPVIVMLV